MKGSIFFVVGAAKAGTTSIFEYLKQHPQVYVHPYKDIACYFCETYGMSITRDEFIRMLSPGDPRAKAIGDICSDYLCEPNAMHGIADMFPDAKIIVVLRNPADRAFSLYQWMVREGYEYMPTFERALASEMFRASRKLKGADLISPSKQAYLYFHSGLYSEQVKRVFAYFPRPQVLAMKYDDLVRNPTEFMHRIYEFIGVDPTFRPAITVYNRGRWPLFPRFQYYCRRYLGRVLPDFIVKSLMASNLLLSRKQTLNGTLRSELLARYVADIGETAKITGLDLRAWLPKSV